jgi:hypothetical protein
VLAFALVQPILELLARYPEFLSVHGIERLAIPGFAVGLAVLPAMFCAALLWSVGRASGRAGHIPLAGFVGVGAAFAMLMPFSRAGAPAAVGLAVAVVSGSAIGILFARLRAVRLGIRWGWVAAVAFVSIFLFRSEIRTLWLGGGSDDRGRAISVGREIPVVFAVFDALPLSSLLDESGEVDGERYPNFRRVVDDGIWFRNHTTSAERTLKSLPAMLTGKLPIATAQPILREHPRNLFTLLEGSHEQHVWEAITRLAGEGARADGGVSLAETLSDTGVLYAHALLPASLRGGLPPIDKGWRGFQWGQAGRGADSNRMVRGWRDFVAGVRGGQGPALHFVHTILPHAPFLFTESGQRYSRDGIEPRGQGDYTGIRDDDTWAAIHSYQRHLLQLAFVDVLLGELIDKLEAESIYDDALVIVTADHGVSFRRGVSRRLAGADNLPDIVAVPLFIKLPGGERAGERVERGSASIDLLPAVCELLAVDSGWEFDGRSLFDLSLDRGSKTILGHRGEVEGSKAEASAVEATVAEKQEWFAHGIYAPGPYAELCGREISDLSVETGTAPFSVGILRPGTQFGTEEGGLLPSEVVGYISAANPRDGFPHLAIALDGVIRAVTHPYKQRKAQRNVVWSALLPESALGGRPHLLDVYAIGEIEDEIVLSPLEIANELPTFLGRRLGQRVVMGVEETGFRRHKPHGFEEFRWTDPQASLSIPLRETERPRSLRIKIAHAAQEGSTLALRLNGEELFVGSVPDGGWEREFSLEGYEFAQDVRIDIESSSFVLEESVEGLPEPRVFGLALEGIWLQRRRVR